MATFINKPKSLIKQHKMWNTHPLSTLGASSLRAHTIPSIFYRLGLNDDHLLTTMTKDASFFNTWKEEHRHTLACPDELQDNIALIIHINFFIYLFEKNVEHGKASELQIDLLEIGQSILTKGLYETVMDLEGLYKKVST